MLSPKSILSLMVVICAIALAGCSHDGNPVKSPAPEDNSITLERPQGNIGGPVQMLRIYQAEDCEIRGLIRKPFWLERDGNQRIVLESNNGGSIRIARIGYPDKLIETDNYIKITITNFTNGLFFPPLYWNYVGWIHLARTFVGAADHVNVVWVP